MSPFDDVIMQAQIPVITVLADILAPDGARHTPIKLWIFFQSSRMSHVSNSVHFFVDLATSFKMADEPSQKPLCILWICFLVPGFYKPHCIVYHPQDFGDVDNNGICRQQLGPLSWYPVMLASLHLIRRSGTRRWASLHNESKLTWLHPNTKTKPYAVILCRPEERE